MPGKRHDRLRCSKCLEKHYMNYLLHNKPKLWNNVKLVGKTKTGVKLECGTCGHKWTSYASAAYRLLK